MPTLRGKWESAISGKQLDSVRKETHPVSVMILYLETDVQVQRQKDKRPLPHQMRRHRLTDRHPQKDQAAEEKALRIASGRIPCRYRGKCTNPSCNYWHPPVCQNYLSESGCKYGNRCYFRHVEADEKPSKKSKKGGAKGSVALLR